MEKEWKKNTIRNLLFYYLLFIYLSLIYIYKYNYR